MVEISAVEPDSIAAEIGLEPGDEIISINGDSIRDYIDFQYKTADNYFIIDIKKSDNSYWELEITREPGESLGIKLDNIIFDRLKICNNDCIFCFVKQMPDNLRKTLNIKDDDYRFSFLQGSFITLTNLSEEEFKRIINLRLSPLNVSVHTTNPTLREQMMRNPNAAKIMSQLKTLSEAGIRFNTQVVLCPGLNDEDELDRTINDLSTFYPSLISLGIVPVGLTRYRNNCYPLVSYEKEGGRKVLEQIKNWQQKLKNKFDKNWLYAADEFYLLAGEDIPEYKDYNGFPQIENGIGLTRKLWTEFNKIKSKIPEKFYNKQIGIITGELGKKALKPIANYLNNIRGLKVELIPIKNSFFGKDVTVTGLLSGNDIKRGLKKNNLPKNIILPGIAINDNGFFLDGISFNELEQEITDKNLYISYNLEEVLEVLFND